MRRIPALVAMAGAALLAPLLAAADVSRTPPPVYAECLAGQLTPAEQVLHGRQAFPDSKEGGANLLSERIFYRDADGPLYRLIHLVACASDQSGIETIGSDTFTYDREREEIFLIEAATIMPDGKRQPVEAKGVFIQTPQRQADQSLYTSQAELRIVYPNASVGASTEAIVLIRENKPVMPGEFAHIKTYGSGWPTFRDRLVLDFPADQLARVKALSTGSGVPEPVDVRYAPGRERRTWTRERVREVAWEEMGPRWEYRASTLWLTTLSSWNAVSAWYAGLVEGRSELGSELAAKVDELTAGLTNSRQIIDRLTEVVANDVRYVGLEFGLAGYQPHPCREVWEKRYGDCKDKANLLRAMLAHKGIEAHLVLLDTRGMGTVERGSPSWLQFNHAILAVKEKGGKYLFCDPTGERLPAGTVGLSDLAREVLVVKRGRAEWVQTPDLLASSIRVEADLTLGKDGALSGWFTLGSTGSDAAYYASYFNGLDQQDRRQKLQELVEIFIPGGAVMDVDFARPARAVQDYAIRAYLVRPSRAVEEHVLTFPFPTSWLPTVTTQGDRRFPYSASRREESVTVRIALPENWELRTTPAAFNADCDAARFSASWESAPGRLTARLAWSPNRAVIAPREYAAFQRSVRSLSAWLSQPVVLAATAGAVTVNGGANAKEELSGFVMLPTGEGQLRLLDEKYPSSGSEAQRRAALKRVLQWFPDDVDTVFTAQVQLALVDQDKEGDEAFARRLRDLLERHGQRVTAESRAWAGYLEAKARWAASRDEAAIEQLQAIADDQSFSAYRRGWSAEAAGRALRTLRPKDALEFLQRHDDYASEAREAIARQIAGILTDQKDAAGLATWAGGLTRDHPQVADALLAVAAQEIASGKLKNGERDSLISALQSVAVNAAEYPRTAEAMQKLSARKNIESARETFRAELAAWLKLHPPSWWTPQKSAEYADTAALIAAIRAANDAHQAERVVDGALQLILHHECDLADFATYTRWAMWWLNSKGLNNELLSTIGSGMLRIPGGAHEDAIDCWNLFAEHLARDGKPAEARAIYLKVIEDSASAKYQITKAGGELGLMELRSRDIPAALAAFHRIEPVHTAHRNGTDYLYVAVLLHLQRQEYDEALQLLVSIQRQEQKYIDASQHNVALKHLLRAAQKPEVLKKHWERQKRFWLSWTAALESSGVVPPAQHELPLPTDYDRVRDALAKAVAAKDAQAFLTALDPYARLAQWIPLFTIDLSGAARDSGAISEQLRLQLYDCILVLLAEAEPIDPDFHSNARVWEVALLVDTGKTDQARARARKIVQESGTESDAGEKVLRIWGIAARGSPEEAEVNALIAQHLESGRKLHDRMSLLRALSDSYQTAANTSAQQVLLEREVARSDFDARSEQGKVLLARLELVRASDGAAREFSRAVAAWRAKRDLEWLEHIAPATLDDPRFGRLKPPVLDAPGGLSRAEIIKFNLLAAADERISIEVRSQALQAAAVNLALSADQLEEFADLLVSVAGMECVSSDIRAGSLAIAIHTTLRAGESRLLERVASSPVLGRMKAEVQADYERAHRALVRAEQGGPEWETEAVALLAGEPMERFSVALVERFVRQLSMRGEYDRAEKLVTRAKDFRIDPALNRAPGSLRLEWLRLVRAIRDRGELYGELRRELARMPEVANSRTPRVISRLLVDNAETLTDDERIAFVADFLDRGYMLPEYTPQLLVVLAGTRKVSLEHPMCLPNLLESVLRSKAQDAVKSEFARGVVMGCDIDQPEVLARVSPLLDEFARSSASRTQPSTLQVVAATEAMHALRVSLHERPPALFDESRIALLPAAMQPVLQLGFHHARGNRAEALRLLETADASSLTHPDLYLLARQILREAGRTAEAELLDESMEAVLKQKMPDFWLVPGEISADWFEAAAALGKADAVPSTFYDRAVRMSASEYRKHTLRAYQAWLREDWLAMCAETDAAVREAPDVYEAYYRRALARNRTGDRAGACNDLRVFLKYCLNSRCYPDARALLAELTGTKAVADVSQGSKQ